LLIYRSTYEYIQRQIFTLLVLIETEMNTLHRSYKIYNFALTALLH